MAPPVSLRLVKESLNQSPGRAVAGALRWCVPLVQCGWGSALRARKEGICWRALQRC